VQLYGNTSSGAIQILQKTPFKQTITAVKAAQIKQELDSKGKAVLYINFDVDKASLQPDGALAVAEIKQLLSENPALSLSIEGHTDNTGAAAHNQSLFAAGGRGAAGYGASKPLVANDSESNKAKNRRVELVKM
jgi:outer membrane protein OmpA-like peptidoglycan-associated protein